MPRISAKGLLKEARRRRVFRAAGLYIVGAWVVVQFALAAFPALSISDTAVRYVWIAALLGFPAAMIFGWRYDIRNGRIVRTSAVGSDVPLSLQRADFVVLAAISVVTLVILAGSLREITNMEPSQARLSLPSDIDNASVAVLPFVNMSADPNNEYFSDGLTDTLLHMLAQLADLKVAARTSSFAFKGQNADIRSIALALGVAHVLEGSVQKAGDRIRVTAQLIRAADGFHVWSQNYDRQLDDIFAIQDEISADVARALGSSLLAEGKNPIVGVFTDDVSAYDVYLYALEQQAVGTFEALAQAEHYFKEALARDSSFVDAKLALVRNSYLKINQRASDLDTESPAMFDLIADVLAENPADLVARQYNLWLLSNIAFREMEIPKYHELMTELFLLFEEGDGDPFVRSQTAKYLSRNERPDDALDLVRQGLVNDPLNVDLLISQAYLFYFAERLDDAEQPLLTALQLQPDNPLLLWYLSGLEVGRNDILKALHYWRRTELADLNDLGSTEEIALTFTELGMYDYSNRWKAALRSRTSDTDLITSVDVQTAAERGDELALREIVPDALDKLFKGEMGEEARNLLLREYVNIMIDDRKSREALDYIESYWPGISDIGNNAASDWKTLGIQQRAVLPLLKETEDEAGYRRAVKAFADNWRESGINLDEGTWNHLWMEYHVNGLEAGKEAFFKTFSEDLYILARSWHRFMRVRWSEELRADPDVAAAVAERQARVDQLREQVLDMVQEPIWQEQ